MDSTSSEITLLLAQLGQGDKSAEARLLPAIYQELHRLAARRLRGEQKAVSLCPTELVNEAYLRLIAKNDQNWNNRAHFFASAARSMRNILIDHIRTREAGKHGGGMVRVELEDRLAFSDDSHEEILALHEALEKLETMDPDQARIVELRFFAGFTLPEIAQLTGASLRTVEREWEFARTWLFAQLNDKKALSQSIQAKSKKHGS